MSKETTGRSNSKTKVITDDYGSIVRQKLAEIALSLGCGEDLALAHCIRHVVNQQTPLSRLLQFALDTASDEFVAEEFYLTHPTILSFLDHAGTDDEEVLFLSYVQGRQDMLTCRRGECKGKIVGRCPAMVCETCGATYYLSVDGISDLMCDRCSGSKVAECTAENRRRRFQIYGLREREMRGT